MTEWLNFVKEFGLGVAVPSGVVLYAGWLIRYVFAENSKREANMYSLISSHLLSMEQRLVSHDQRETEFMTSMHESQRYQREEHDRIMKGLNDITIILAKLNGHN